MKKMILVSVIIYNPNISQLKRNIISFISEVDKVVLWCNSPISDKDINDLKDTPYFEKIEIFENQSNEGIAYPLNKCIKYAKDKKYDYLISMDQDSVWVNFRHYKQRAELAFDENRDVVVIGPRTISEGIDTGDIRIQNDEYVDYVITSGAIYELSRLNSNNPFNEIYFIDAVDEEFCFNQLASGNKTMMLGDCFLKQNFGNPQRHVIFKHLFYTPGYSSQRYYYIVRNHILLSKCDYVPNRYKKYILYNYVYILMIKVILFEKNKLLNLKSFISALYDSWKLSQKERI